MAKKKNFNVDIGTIKINEYGQIYEFRESEESKKKREEIKEKYQHFDDYGNDQRRRKKKAFEGDPEKLF